MAVAGTPSGRDLPFGMVIEENWASRYGTGLEQPTIYDFAKNLRTKNDNKFCRVTRPGLQI
jgi:hypothetical protein